MRNFLSIAWTMKNDFYENHSLLENVFLTKNMVLVGPEKISSHNFGSDSFQNIEGFSQRKL